MKRIFCLLIITGLLVSGMVQPTKVLGFLDIFGAWDPSLAVVMAAALAVAAPGFMLARRRSRPVRVRPPRYRFIDCGMRGSIPIIATRRIR
jgi:uncharacterized membrane protein YedE/YeeE